MMIGVIVGLVGVAFYKALAWANEMRSAHEWLIYLLPAGGLLIVGLYKLCKIEKDKGTNFVLVSVRSQEKITVKTAPLIFGATVLTHLFGGSAGKEGAALQIGGSIADKIGRHMKLDEKDKTVFTMCGMAAAFSAVFGTPVCAAVFSMEVVSVGVMYYAAFVPCMISSVVSYLLASFFGVHSFATTLSGVGSVTALDIGRVLLLSILVAGLSWVFCYVLKGTSKLFQKCLANPYLRIAVGGLIVIVLTKAVGTDAYNGAGTGVLASALAGNARPEAFVLKIIFTAVTIGAGYKGGEIVPTFFTGATFGAVAGQALGLNASFGAGLGMIGMFCGVTNCPMTSLIMSVELFGAQGIVYFALTCAVCYMLSGYIGLYSEQKILYSKFRPVFIDKKVN